MDSQYRDGHFHLSELPHSYGENVHILGDPFALSQLARLCSSDTTQPEFNQIIVSLYRHLLTAVINVEMPRVVRRVRTRMSAVTERGVFEGSLIDEQTQVVCVDIARAGILPSQVCYDTCNAVFNPDVVRQDHLIMSRVTNEDDEVTGARISGGKIGGPIDGRYVLFPDPMGATGKSLITAIQYYHDNHGQKPAAMITLNLIVTPQFIKALTEAIPGVRIYALRVDRGMSAEDVLRTPFGERWDEETGLTDNHYIVPGGGGFGELMNNSYV